MADPKVEGINTQLKRFQEKRGSLAEAVNKVKDEVKDFIDRWFEEIYNSIDAQIEKNDISIANFIKERQLLEARQKELDIVQARLDPFIKILADAKSGRLQL